MNPLLILKYGKYIGIGLLVIVLCYFVWDIKSTYNDNKTLKAELVTKAQAIENLNKDIKNQKDLYKKTLERKDKVEIVEKERIVYVDKVKKADTVYLEKIKKEIEYIKENNPNSLDKYYGMTYNTILTCIESTTELKDKSCGE